MPQGVFIGSHCALGVALQFVYTSYPDSQQDLSLTFAKGSHLFQAIHSRSERTDGRE